MTRKKKWIVGIIALSVVLGAGVGGVAGGLSSRQNGSKSTVNAHSHSVDSHAVRIDNHLFRLRSRRLLGPIVGRVDIYHKKNQVRLALWLASPRPAYSSFLDAYPGLEVVPPGDPHLDAGDKYAALPSAENTSPELVVPSGLEVVVANVPKGIKDVESQNTKTRRLLGTRKRKWIAGTVLLVVLGAIAGGGVAGGLASRGNDSEPSRYMQVLHLNNDEAARPTATFSIIVDIIPPQPTPVSTIADVPSGDIPTIHALVVRKPPDPLDS
ncbi:hypothetical protein QBC44DRAFT_360596 [Cladorrhinum sp. PSN332]|nr:hypothetical protein QBC44DRAFT_360596 [Cladorrhinum sp. PSN332]